MAEMVYRLGGRHRALWEYQEGQTWHVHAQTELLEAALERGERAVAFTMRGAEYTVDLAAGTQTNDATRFVRSVRRLEGMSLAAAG